MLSSMFTAISALGAQQNYLDVVSDNLANTNTNGFKASRVLFQDQYSQLISPGSAPTTTTGGTNPTQIGLGVQTGYISPVFTQGTLQSTGRNLDLAIQGDGFFIYGSNGNQLYSREGSLNLDSSGTLVNSATGLPVQGWTAAADGTIDTTAPVGNIKVSTNQTIAQATTQAGFAGNLNSSTLTTDPAIPVSMGLYDSLGNVQAATVAFTRTGANDWSWAVTNPAGATGNGTVTFENNGQYVSSTGAASLNVPGSTGANAVNPTLDFSKLTMLSAATGVTVPSQNGLPAGSVTDINIAQDTGVVSLVYSNGMNQTVGQVALATFTNPDGLQRTGNTMFKVGLNSGNPQIGPSGTGGRGTISSGYLEASNVDLAQEMTNMILAERGFQANSKVISTSDEILQTLVNLKQ
ncbi:MAG: flagellar hook protein FlgE [Anaerolineaceae bacterium]|nr:flagellar hook protein FlgE [Anaerolineaceae bacterium]